jgi:[acyl-carrier-protein] S-malonyltransferase
MGRDLAERFPAAQETFQRIDEALGVSLSRLMWEGPESELTLTHNTQPAILTHSAAVWSVVGEHLTGVARAAAGHSLGEYSAYVTAGALTPEAAARVVRRRGELMFEAGIARPGAMTAILGLGTDVVEEACREASSTTEIAVAANLNAPDQTVLSGDPAAVERAASLCKAKGAKRVVALKVSGAFHSPLMSPAVAGLEQALAGAGFRDPGIPVIANATAEPVRSAADATRLLREQLTSPVRWVACMQRAAALVPGATFVEIGPGNVLSGLVKRSVPNAQTATLGTADEIEKYLQTATV